VHLCEGHGPENRFFFFFFFLLSLPLNVDNRFSKFDVKHYSSRVSLVFSSFLKFFLSSLFSRHFF